MPGPEKHCRTCTCAAKPPPAPRVRVVMDTLEGIRGYVSGVYAGEMAAVKRMLRYYEPADILACYEYTKKQPFWEGKSLTMMTLAKDIGEWKRRHKTERERRQGYADEYIRRRGPLKQVEE